MYCFTQSSKQPEALERCYQIRSKVLQANTKLTKEVSWYPSATRSRQSLTFSVTQKCAHIYTRDLNSAQSTYNGNTLKQLENVIFMSEVWIWLLKSENPLISFLKIIAWADRNKNKETTFPHSGRSFDQPVASRISSEILITWSLHHCDLWSCLHPAFCVL